MYVAECRIVTSYVQCDQHATYFNSLLTKHDEGSPVDLSHLWSIYFMCIHFHLWAICWHYTWTCGHHDRQLHQVATAWYYHDQIGWHTRWPTNSWEVAAVLSLPPKNSLRTAIKLNMLYYLCLDLSDAGTLFPRGGCDFSEYSNVYQTVHTQSHRLLRVTQMAATCICARIYFLGSIYICIPHIRTPAYGSILSYNTVTRTTAWNKHTNIHELHNPMILSRPLSWQDHHYLLSWEAWQHIFAVHGNPWHAGTAAVVSS